MKKSTRAARSVGLVLLLSAAACSEARELPEPILAVAVGYAQTCILLTGGLARCSGLNDHGELGLGHAAHAWENYTESGYKDPVINLGTGKTATALAGGDGHTCALLKEGSVKCWGYNGFGQLGLGDAYLRGERPNQMGDNLAAVDLGEGETATAVATGNFFTCALLNDGSVKCWGANGAGQLGLGRNDNRGDELTETVDRLPAVDLGAGKTATAITAGNNHTCALLNDGTVKCWGQNFTGQLGLGDQRDRGEAPDEMGDNLPAIDLGAGKTATAIAAGYGHTCALLNDGSVKCWGYNGEGELGLGDTIDRGDNPGEMGDSLPTVDLGTGKTAIALGTGSSQTCVVLMDGSVKCWGGNLWGLLGLDGIDNHGDGPGEMGDNLPAVDLGQGKTAIAISVGGYRTCALLNDGNIKCWGFRPSG